jgi:signal transduction histidine kinase
MAGIDHNLAWRSHLVATNLNRLRWIWLVTLPLLFLYAPLTLILPEVNGTFRKTLWDTVLVFLLLALTELARRMPPESPWRMRYIWFAAATVLVNMDAWFFITVRLVGQNSDYVLGVLVFGAFLLAPPKAMAILLGLNHVLFCALLLLEPQSRNVVLAGLVDGTSVVVLVWVVSFLLYRAQQQEFFKTRLLAASNSDLREVMAIAAHDLRSPLLGLRDLITLARGELTEESAKLSRVLDMATDSCTGMVRLVSRLLEAHAAEEAEGSLNLELQDLRLAVQAAGDQLGATANSKNQRIRFALPPEPAMARIDSTAFAQIAENLIGNALKFSPSGSDVECSLFTTGQTWRLEVRDQGPGIPPEERSRLFQKFHRGSARPTGGESSTGLGLFIVRALTEAMGGRVSHDTRDPDHSTGSIFRIELPVIL